MHAPALQVALLNDKVLLAHVPCLRGAHLPYEGPQPWIFKRSRVHHHQRLTCMETSAFLRNNGLDGSDQIPNQQQVKQHGQRKVRLLTYLRQVMPAPAGALSTWYAFLFAH